LRQHCRWWDGKIFIMAYDSVVNISEYTTPIKRWFLVVLIATLLGALVGFGLFQTRSRQFVAKAEVQVRPLVSQSADSNIDINRQINTITEEFVASSQRVAERALNIIEIAEKNGTTNYSDPSVLEEAEGLSADPASVIEVLENVEVQVVDGSQILEVSASSDDPERAQQLAQSVSVAYIDFRKTEALRARTETREKLEARELALAEELAKIYSENDIDAAGNIAGGADAQLVIGKRQELESIGRTFASLDASTVDSGVVLSDARVPRQKDGLPEIAGPVMGGLIGLIIGLAAVFVIDRQDDRLRSASTELEALGVPVLGTAPVHSKQSASRISLFANNSPGADAYRRVQGSLMFNLQQENKSLIVVAGIKNGKASAFVTANLAAMAARFGRKTLLVGADLRQPINDGIGISDVVLGNAALTNAIENVAEIDSNLDILGGGTITSKPADILQTEAFSRLLSAVHADYDLVLVAAPAILEVADAMDIARLCQGALIVVDSATESRKSIADSISQVRNVGSDIVGVVVTE